MEHLPDLQLPADSPSGTPKKRPQLEARGFTERGAPADSPNLLAVDQVDDGNVERVRSLSSSL